MPQKHTNASFDCLLSQVNPSIIRIGDYHNLSTKLQVRCTTCHHQWLVTPKNISVKRTGCPNCNHEAKRLDYAEIRANLLERGIHMLANPRNVDQVVNFSCSRDTSHVWCTSVSAIVHQTHGCPHCAGNIKYDGVTIQRLLDDLGTGLKLFGPYNGMNKPTQFMCSRSHTWTVSPSNILHAGSDRCPVCYPYPKGRGFGRRVVVDDILFRSTLEAECYSLTKHRDIQVELQRPYGLRRYTCDFYFPDTRTWVEVSSFNNQQYLSRIAAKRMFVESVLGEKFMFASSVSSFARILELQHR